jgi:hypothetical protein
LPEWVGWAEGEDRMSASGEDRISAFERHCELLLRTYPAAYRSERAAEIIGTLLETTPEGRAWPLPRDVRGLVTGGLAARAALNRRNTTAANLRVAVFVGVAAYLAYNAAAVLGFVLFTTTGPARYGLVDWPLVIGTGLSAACALTAWVSRRRAIVLTFALPAAAAFVIAGPWGTVSGTAVTELACVTALIALNGGDRPSRRWLWPVGLIVLAAALMPFTSGVPVDLPYTCVLSLVFASIVWSAVDARPVIASVVFVSALYLPATIDQLANGFTPQVGAPLLAICLAVAALAIWRLRRQSAHPGRPVAR